MDANYLVELRRKFETFRRPVGFNYVHFLLIHLYNSSSSSALIVKTYPLYSIFSRLLRKLDLHEQEQDNNQSIIDAIIIILSQNDVYLTETVEQTYLNMNIYPISCLFRLYSPIHLILFIEPLILSKDDRLNNIIKRIFANEYPKDKCDYIHFCIAHRKTNLIIDFLSGSIQQDENQDNWLISKINSPSDRSWLPIHYASYVADRDLVEKLCTQYAQLMEPFHFVLPKSRMRDFVDNPFDYLLRASGMKRITSNPGNTVLNLHDDVDDDSLILPLMTDDDDEEILSTSPLVIEQRRDERSDSFTADQEAIQAADADIPDADQLESSMQFPRDTLLRSLVEQAKGLVYFIPSPLLLASACPLNGDQYKEYYHEIIRYLLNSKLVDIDGLNHNSLTENTIEYFSRHKYANFTRTRSLPYIYYQCDALFTSSSSSPSISNPSRMSQFSDDGEKGFKLIYYLTILNQRSLFSRFENFDQYLLRHLLDLHSYQIEKAFGNKIIFNQYTKGFILEREQINELTLRLLIRYDIHNEQELYQIDVNYFVVDSYIDQFTDTYISLFHTPITMAIQNGCLSIVDIILSNKCLNQNTNWGTLAMHELATCIDQLFTRRGKITLEMFTKFCSSIANIHSDEYVIQQRIFVHTFATCIRYNAKLELEHLITNYAKIYYDSCEKYPTDIRHNILAYCVVRNQATVLEELMSAFSTLNSNSSQLYILPLSNLSSSSSSTDSLSTIVNNTKDKPVGISTSINSLYSCSGDEYRQCRRVRNTAIATQQKQNPTHYLSHQDGRNSNRQTIDERSRPRISRFWRTVRSLQLGLRHRQSGHYDQLINSSDSIDRRPTTVLQTISEVGNSFHRADLEIAQPVLNELPATMPVLPPPLFISLSNNDQDEEQEVTPVTGQTLLHIGARLPGHEDVVRVLIGENTSMTAISNSHGQIPLLCAIHAGSTLTAQLLMDADPYSLIAIDHKRSSVFHYCCEKKNDVLLASMLNLLRRLSSNQSVRIQALQHLVESNTDEQTPFSIACYNGGIKCLKQLFDSKWLLRRVQLSNLITSDGIKKCIDNNQIDIIIYLVSDLRRFRVIISLLIDVVFTEPVHPSTDMVVARRQYNVLEYAILLKKIDFVKVFVSVSVPRTIEKKPNIEEHLAVVRSSNVITQEPLIHEEYKRFLTRYSLPFKHNQFDQMPIQRMLKIPSLVPFVPNLLEQFVDGDGMDLSVIDDCLCSKPIPSRCVYGQNSSMHNINHPNTNKIHEFTTNQWVREHPLNLISECDYAPIYDHPLVITTVDSKAELFGNILYLFILLIQALYVALYTAVTLATRTPKYYEHDYVDFENDTCVQMCNILTNKTNHSDELYEGTFVLYVFRFILFLCSCAALLKEFIQILTQRGRYFRAFFLNLLEVLTYSCGIIFAMDIHNCSRHSSIRCKFQYDFGALGVACVWTVLLLVFVNSLKLGKYGLLFITIFLTFLKFCFIYVFIWIGYLFAFHMLLTQNPSFETVFTSIPRMIAMLTGEFNFENLFYTDGEPVRGTTMAKIIFSTFVFVVHICVMNILIGLAVSDVNDFQINAKRENLRSRIRTVLNFQAKFGSICHTSSRLMFALNRHFPQLLIGLKFDVSKLSIRMKPVQIANRTTNLIRCRVGYVTMQKPGETSSNNAQMKENTQEDYNEKLMHKVDEIREEIDKTQLRFTQELHRLTINLSKLIEK